MADVVVTSPGPDSGDLPFHPELDGSPAADPSVNHVAISESGLTIQPSSTPNIQPSSAPNTPLVKKIINSGTFGSGTVKPTPRPSAGATTTKSAAALALKKSNSASAAGVVSKSTMASSRAPTAASSASRRSSMALAAKTGASAATKASAPPPSSSKSASARPSVVSPSGSVASLKSSATAHRPRTSVSEGTKRTTPTSTRPAPTATKTTTPSKSAPPRSSNAGAKSSGSISSIHEVKENRKDSEELQNKLNDATGELVLKAQVVSDLENRIQQLQTSLADVQLRVASVQDLEQANASLEAKYKSELEASSRQKDELNTSVTGQLTTASEKVAALLSAIQDKEELIESLRSQKSALEGELSAVTQKVKITHEAHISATQSERQNLLKVEAELKSAIADIEALKLVHAETTQILDSKSRGLDESAARIEELEIQINRLKAEREEHANKVSELEVEILELKECQETLEDEREKVVVKVKSLEEQMSTLIAASKQAEEDARFKATDHEARITELQSQHAQELQIAADEHAKITISLESVQAQLQTAQREHEQAKKDIQAATEAHSQTLKDKEGSFLEQSARLEEEIKKITTDLEEQEANYNSRLDAINAEHKTLLQDAFERAKIEAGNEHALELQNLRASSNATIEQLRAANQATIEDLNATHTATLESDLKALAKQINNLNLDLKATQDDLSKAKASLDTARTDVENLTKQRDEALAAAATSSAVASKKQLEIAELTNELSRSNDDLQAVTDMLNLTKASLSEMSDNHAKELEEGARARAEETTKLRATHDAEVAVFATQKSELAIRVSDLDGELATLKASIASEHLKSNGVSVSHPPSPDSSGVTREELQRMHEAHNLKLYDLQAEHDSAIKIVQEELRAVQLKAEELQQEVSRKAMEIKYLEQDQEDSQEQISRLKEDVDTIARRLNKELPSD